jgi:NAD(P)-dependent dehydrogenase (short-subunit alcohol dehydrogenase family)
MADRNQFGADTTVDEVLEGIDLTGKVAIVTGASGGLGAEAARGLAQAGAAVTLTARDLAKGQTVADAIRASTGNANVDVMELELQRPASVRAFAKAWLGSHDRLDLLLNNAGVMACPLERTDEGWEMQFATCHLGHFLLTGLLAPALLAGAPSRIVNVSSGGHRFSPVRLDDPHFERDEYDKWVAYGQAKTANILHAVELDRRLKSRGVRAFAIHPGAIVTDLGRHLSRDDMVAMNARVPGGQGLRFKQVDAGASTEVYAATAPELEGQGGCYLEDCHVAGLREEPTAMQGVMPYALDADAAARLWTLSEQTLGEAFDL